MENSRFLGNLPENIVYNGLLYTYNLRENAFINQFGHRIDPSAAPAFITEAKAFEQQNLAILDISSSSSDNGNSRGGGETELGAVTDFKTILNPDSPTTSIILEWDDPVSYTADSYIIFRSTTIDGTYTEIGTVPDPEIKIFTDTGLTPDQPYFYYVKAVKNGKQSIGTEVLELATLGVEPAPVGITAPSGLTASSVTQTQLRLSWTDNSNNELGFFIYQSTDGLAFTPVFGVGAGITSANIRPLTQDTLYYYRVNAYATGSTSAYSNLISVRTLPTPPTTPTFTSILAGSSSQINLNWTNVANEIGYNLYRSLNDVSYTGITTLSANVTGFTNSGLSAGTLYFYKIEAFNAGGTSALSGATSATTLPAGTAPSAPTGFTAISATSNSVTLQWTDTSTNEDGFLIYYRGIT
jgi:titin